MADVRNYGSINATGACFDVLSIIILIFNADDSGLKYTSISDTKGKVIEGSMLYKETPCHVVLWDDDYFVGTTTDGKGILHLSV